MENFNGLEIGKSIITADRSKLIKERDLEIINFR